MSKTPAQFARSVRRLPGELEQAAERGVAKSALTVTRSIRSELQRVTGGDSRMSGVGKRGRKVGARYRVRGGSEPSALITAEGPVHLLERDTKAHTIPRERRRGRRRIVVTPQGPRARVNHPGTQGRQPFAKGVNAAAPKVPRVIQQEVSTALRRTFS